MRLAKLYSKVGRASKALALCLLLSACASYEYNSVSIESADTLPSDHTIASSDQLALDVGIVLLDSGAELSDDVSVEYAKVRASEAVWFSSKIKDALDSSQAWGMVRVAPLETTPFDLNISGKLIESNGESVILQVTAIDALDQTWLDKEYEYRTSRYSYDPEIALKQDPFQPIFIQIANDLFDQLTQRTASDLLSLRQVSRLRFAEYFLPELVADYLVEDEQGIRLIRAPAQGDPFMAKIDAIYDRNQVFLDVVQDYYRAFNDNMQKPYEEWRSLSFKEVQQERILREQARKEKLAGVALLVGGVAAGSGSGSSAALTRYVSLVSGGYIFAKTYEKNSRAAMHASTLRELGASLEGELAPSIVDLQDRTVTLGGTVDQQFDRWRETLQSLFRAEFNIQDAIEAELN